MRSSILITFLVAAISSSTYGDNHIFGVEINTDQLHTLNAEQVDNEVQAKTDLVKQIDELQKKLPSDGRAWIIEFRKFVTTEREIIQKLNVELSKLNTDCLTNINDEELKKQISEEVFGKLKKGLQDYVNMLKTFDFSQTVWEGRSFLGNPFEDFVGRITAVDPEALKVKPMLDAFKKANINLSKAKNAIYGTMASFTKSLEPQKKKSHTVMVEIRNLNLLAVPNTTKKVNKSIKSLASKLKKLQSSIENVNNIPAVFQCFMQKRAWLDEIRTQLMNMDKIQANLNTELNQV